MALWMCDLRARWKGTTISSWVDRLNRPVDGASLAAFRILFGLLMAVGTLRFAAMGWIERSFTQPSFFFKYDGFGWVPVPSAPGIYFLFATVFFAAVGVALGWRYRASATVFFVGFTWIELMDASNYLNHYYLASLLGLLLIFLPAHSMWSLDARAGRGPCSALVPFWAVAIPRFQLAVVYFFAGLAKATPDWLFHAQPMAIWMSANQDLPIIGDWFLKSWAHFAASWAGFLYDLTIWMFLLNSRSRGFAYAVVLVFHGLTHFMFPIGMFPFVMSIGTLIFFSPSWPRRWIRTAQVPAVTAVAPNADFRWSWIAASAFAIYAVIQVALPLRNHLLYDGNILWTEEGMRWSWRVMAREKNGSVDFHVLYKKTGREWVVPASQELARHQEYEMSGQPDLIWQLAQKIARDFQNRGQDVSVTAEAWVSLNGRPPALLIDPDVDLTTVEEGWHPKSWLRQEPHSVGLTKVMQEDAR